MKYFKTLALLLFLSALSFFACNDNSDAVKQKARESLPVTNSPALPTASTPNPATAEPVQNAAGVWHYTCSKGCPKGGDKGQNCATCGGPLAHNQAYHANSTPPATNPINNSTNPSATTPTLTPPTPAAEPVQNAAGVWHYTCSKGCPKGGDKGQSCATCGGPLAHNTAYHN